MIGADFSKKSIYLDVYDKYAEKSAFESFKKPLTKNAFITADSSITLLGAVGTKVTSVPGRITDSRFYYDIALNKAQLIGIGENTDTF